MYMWSTSTPSEDEGDEMVLNQKISIGDTTYVWKLPEKGLQYFEMERGGFVAFENLYLPCFTEHDIELSFYDVDDLTYNDQSTTRYVNCYSSGIIFAHDFQLGSNKEKGHYKVFGRMTQTGKIN
jgi:hypothetical protein